MKVIQKNNYLTLAEVQVFGTGGKVKLSGFLGSGNLKLLSHGAKATSSSIGWGGHPSRAIDGNFNQYYNGKSVMHTKLGKRATTPL